MTNCVCSSQLLPFAIRTNCLKSFLVRRTDPSAILLAIETDALRICEVNPYISCVGKSSVSV